MSIVCTCMSLVRHSYVTHMYLYVTRMCLYITCMYSYVICITLVCSRMSSVCHWYVLVCNGMSLVCTRMSSVCHSYVLVCHPYFTRMWFYHEPWVHDLPWTLGTWFSLNWQFQLELFSVRSFFVKNFWYNSILTRKPFFLFSIFSVRHTAFLFDCRKTKNYGWPLFYQFNLFMLLNN